MKRLLQSCSLAPAYVLTLVLATAFPCLSRQEMPLPENPLEGQKLFSEKGCVRCHSIMGRGGKIGSDLAKTQANHSPAGIVALMWNHAADMSKAMEVWQSIPKLTEQELASVVSFLFSIDYFDEPGDVVWGKVVFEKSGCRRCHQVGGNGGKIGPALDKVSRFGSPLFLAQAMWNHGVGMSRTMERLGLARPTFEGSEFADLLKYLQSISAGDNYEMSFMVPGSPKKGERLFRSKGCITCHAVGEQRKAIGPDLTKKQFRRGAIAIAGSMWNHGYRMWQTMKQREITPPRFEGNELADIIAYLYFLEFQQRAGDPVRGKDLVQSKGCINCHLIGGRGGASGPDLARSQHFSNVLTIAARMWNHNLDMQKRMRESNIPFPRFAEREMTDLLSYIRFQGK